MGITEGKNHLEDLGVDGRKISKLFKSCDGAARIGLVWSRLGAVGGRM